MTAIINYNHNNLTNSTPLFDSGMLITFALCYKIDMGLGIVVGVAVTKAISISKFIRKNIQNTQLKLSGNAKLIGLNI